MPDPPDDDVYELSDDDAIEPDASGFTPAHSNTGDYELSEITDNPVRGDLEIIMHPARYCRACGFDLTLIDVSPCPGCEKAFDPDDDATTRDTPLPEQENFWLQRPRLAGYGLLALFILGRPIIGFVGAHRRYGGAEAGRGLGVHRRQVERVDPGLRVERELVEIALDLAAELTEYREMMPDATISRIDVEAVAKEAGVKLSDSETVIRSRMIRSRRFRPTRTWFCSSSPTERIRRLPRWSISSMWPMSDSRLIK